MRILASLVFAALAVLGVVSCTSGPTVKPVSTATPGTLETTIPVVGISTGGSFSFGGGAVDPAASRYYLADRTNKSVDVFDTRSLMQIAQVQDNFAGAQASSAKSGPDSIVLANGNLYVGDVNSVKVISASTLTPVTTIATGSAGFRSSEGCYDSTDGLVMFANPNDTPPYVSWIQTSTNTVFATLTFNGSAGAPTATHVVGCVYDPGTKNFFVNNKGSTANPGGEVDVISAASVLADAPKVSGAFGLGVCSPTGIALGANETLLVACHPAAGNPEFLPFVSAAGPILATLTTTGGGDNVTYDAVRNRFYCACEDWTSTGIAGGPPTPVLGVIDASTMSLIVNAPTGTNSSSVSIDTSAGRVFVPVTPTSTFNGGVNVYTP